MKWYTFTLVAAVSLFLVSGCRTSKQELNPHWQKAAQVMAAEKNSEASGLVWQPFPDYNNPVHREIWKAYVKKGKIGSAYGTICSYYGVYLVTAVFASMDIEPESFFYDPRLHGVIMCSDSIALMFYKGSQEANPTNAVTLVQHLSAANGFKSFVVTNSANIPHTAFAKNNPKLSFERFLASKSIIIAPPSLMRLDGDDYYKGYDAYNVFVYEPCGGELYRYEVRCHDGRFGGIRRFLVGAEIGDFSLLY